MPEIAGESAILVDPYDIISIKNAMESILFETNRKNLQKKGIARAEKFSWHNTAQQVLSVYKSYQSTI
jgi:glycosyltransferase involved in cell wall biosynthesis